MRTMEELREFCDSHGIEMFASNITFDISRSTKITFSIPNHCWNIVLEDYLPECVKVERMYEGIKKYILPYVQTNISIPQSVKFVYDTLSNEFAKGELEKAVNRSLTIKKVIFNNPATIVYWTDDTKTVVKCGKNDKFSEEVGIALAFMKKALGNKGNYNNIFRQYTSQSNNTKVEDINYMRDVIRNYCVGRSCFTDCELHEYTVAKGNPCFSARSTDDQIKFNYSILEKAGVIDDCK